MNETRKLRVFLSYAHADAMPARKLYKYLREKGFNVWFDEEKLVPGQDWQVEIEKAIYNSDAAIICLSRNSIEKEGFVQKEFKFALDKTLEIPEGRIFVIPVRLQECEVPIRMGRLHWVDLYKDDGYKKLLKGLKARANQLDIVTLPNKTAKQQQQAQEKLTPNSFSDTSIALENQPPHKRDTKLDYKIYSAVNSSLVFILKWVLPYLLLLLMIPNRFMWRDSEIEIYNRLLLISVVVIPIIISTIQFYVFRRKLSLDYRWIVLNFLIVPFLLVFAGIFESLYKGANIGTNITFSYEIVRAGWLCINFSAGMVALIKPRAIENFFATAILNASFWIVWLAIPFAGVLFIAGQVLSLVLLDIIGEALITQPSSPNSTFDESLWTVVMYTYFGVFPGLFMSLLQWLKLRQRINAWWWIPLNTIGFFIIGNLFLDGTNMLWDEILLMIGLILNFILGPILFSFGKRINP